MVDGEICCWLWYHSHKRPVKHNLYLMVSINDVYQPSLFMSLPAANSMAASCLCCACFAFFSGLVLLGWSVTDVMPLTKLLATCALAFDSASWNHLSAKCTSPTRVKQLPCRLCLTPALIPQHRAAMSSRCQGSRHPRSPSSRSSGLRYVWAQKKKPIITKSYIQVPSDMLIV